MIIFLRGQVVGMIFICKSIPLSTNFFVSTIFNHSITECFISYESIMESLDQLLLALLLQLVGRKVFPVSRLFFFLTTEGDSSVTKMARPRHTTKPSASRSRSTSWTRGVSPSAPRARGSAPTVKKPLRVPPHKTPWNPSNAPSLFCSTAEDWLLPSRACPGELADEFLGLS